jgi:prephenate dehydrogenase
VSAQKKPEISIIGLGLIGGSIGLALKEADVASSVIGHDKDPGTSSRAKKLGAVDKTHWNLISACEESDLIVLATPVSAIESTMEAIAPYLRPGCVVMDTASLKEPVLAWAAKQPVLAWAAKTLPEEAHFVGGNPIVSSRTSSTEAGIEAARADLFRKSFFCLTPSPMADADAVKLASDFVSVLGASPLFFDPVEHDGLMAVVDHLPAVMALALMEMAKDQPSWRELRKVAGASFEESTQLVSADPASFGELARENQESILRAIDAFAGVFASLRQNLADGETEAIVKSAEKARDERDRWLHDRAEGRWEMASQADLPARSSMLTDAFIGGWWRRRQRKGEDT